MTDDLENRSRARIGALLDKKWTLERLIGVGGMAAVYSARHRNGARAAVKVLHHHLSRHAEVRERFLREGYAANRVEHPGAVKVLDDDVVREGPDQGTAYIVMELLDGESLHDRVERGPPLTEREFLAVADEVLDVLDAAHRQGVIHRDLKPENLFLSRDEQGETGRPRVKVLDFGLARILQGQAITSHGLALGTPSFMSPEQAAGLIDQIDGRTDLFALAATGFRVRTGRRIHEGDNVVDLVRKMSTIPAPPIRDVAVDASEAFARVIDRGLAFRREDRFANASEMQIGVRAALEDLDVGLARTLFELPKPVPPPRAFPPTDEPTVADQLPNPSAPKPAESGRSAGEAPAASASLPAANARRPMRVAALGAVAFAIAATLLVYPSVRHLAARAVGPRPSAVPEVDASSAWALAPSVARSPERGVGDEPEFVGNDDDAAIPALQDASMRPSTTAPANRVVPTRPAPPRGPRKRRPYSSPFRR